MSVTNLVKNYFTKEPLTENQNGKPHRVITNWSGLKVWTSNKAKICVVFDDIELLMNILTNPKIYSKIMFWHSEKDQRQKAKAMENKMNNLKVFDTKEEILDQTIDWSKAKFGGNMAFSITSEMIDLFSKSKPGKIQQISATDWALAIENAGGSHGPALKNKQKLLDLGLKKIIHLPYKFFKQVEKDSLKLDVAQIGALYFETELGYDGDIEVVDFKSGKSYFASRNATGFPRTEFSYKLREAQPKIKLPNMFCWNDKSKNHKKWIEDFNLAKKLANKYPIAISHYAGREGGGTRDLENGLINFLGTAKIINQIPTNETDLMNWNLYDWFILCFDDKQSRDSFLSLCNSKIIQRAMTDMNFKVERFTGPGLRLLPEFPNKKWTDKSVEDYVEKNY